jgi:hypothetical protein
MHLAYPWRSPIKSGLHTQCMADHGFRSTSICYLQKTEHFGYKKYGISYQEINIFVSRSVATRVGCKEEKEVTAAVKLVTT